MLRSKARWIVNEADDNSIIQLTEVLGIDPVAARLLVLRGLSDPEEARRFLSGGREEFHDPYLLDGMAAAVERIRRAVAAREKIRIYGDYDADGVSSTALMIFLMQELGADFDYYIPHRMNEGYGLNREALQLACRQGVALIVTVDNGISAADEIAFATELGMDVIVTDHHEPPERLPDACAVINPKKPGCAYPFKHLAGVGVALKVAQALVDVVPEHWLELAAIGTIADLMPLTGENRIIARLGLAALRTTSSPGLKALMSIAHIAREEVTAVHVGFALAPRINAGGRLDSAGEAVRLLTTSSEQEAEHLANDLDGLNRERQRIVEDITRAAVSMVRLEEETGQAADRVLVLAGEDWNVGVVGIVASKLVEKFYRPTVILCLDPERRTAKGSARSIAGFDLYRSLSECGDLLEHYGGHQAAAGMTLSADNIGELRTRLNDCARKWLTEDDYTPLLKADMSCDLASFPFGSIAVMEQLAPYGMGNPTPRFVFRDIAVQEMRTIGRDRQHLKLLCGQAGTSSGKADEAAGGKAVPVEALAFGKGELLEEISPTARLELLGEVGINEWNGQRKPQIIIQDIRVPGLQVFDWRGLPKSRDKLGQWLTTGPSAKGLLCGGSSDADAMRTLAQTIGPDLAGSALKLPVWRYGDEGEPPWTPVSEAAKGQSAVEVRELLLLTLPERLSALEEALASAGPLERVYAVLAAPPSMEVRLPSRDLFKKVYAELYKGAWSDGRPGMLQAFSRRSGMSEPMIAFILNVFEELGLIERTEQAYRIVPAADKRELSSSRLYRRKLGLEDVEQALVYSSSHELMEWIVSRLQPGGQQIEEGIV